MKNKIKQHYKTEKNKTSKEGQTQDLIKDLARADDDGFVVAKTEDFSAPTAPVFSKRGLRK